MNRCCAPKYLLDLLGKKWVFKLLRHLDKPRKFSDLQEALPGITNHVLAEETQLLIDEGLISHKDKVYLLTPSGNALVEAMEPLFLWAETHKALPQCSKELDCCNCARYNEGK